LHTTLDFYQRTESYLEKAKVLRARFETDPDKLKPEDLDFLFRTLDKAPRVMAKDTDYGLAKGSSPLLAIDTRFTMK
jgi:hypothetical protein